MSTENDARRLGEALAAKAVIEAEAATIRRRLETAFLEAYADTGARRKIDLDGEISVRLDKPNPSADIVDDTAFTAWVADRFPDEVETRVVIKSSAFTKALLGQVQFDDDTREPYLLDEGTGAVDPVPGVALNPGRPTFVATLDKARKAAAARRGAADAMREVQP